MTEHQQPSNVPGSAVPDSTTPITGNPSPDTSRTVTAEMVAYLHEGMNTAHIHRDGTVAGGPMCTEYDQECIVLTDKRAKELANIRRETFGDLMNKVDAYQEGIPDNREELMSILHDGFGWTIRHDDINGLTYTAPDRTTIVILDDIQDNDITVTRYRPGPATAGPWDELWKVSMTASTPVRVMLAVAMGA